MRSDARDLVALVADKDAEYALRGLLSRPQALCVRPVKCDVWVHPGHDSACLRKAVQFLRPYARAYHHALVIFDRHGCGKEAESRETLEAEVERRLAAAGWDDRAAVIVIDPELENWVWSDSPEVDPTLGWANSLQSLRQWVVEQGFTMSKGKPGCPKEAMLAALRAVRKPRSPALFQQLAERVGLGRCQDEAFAKLRACLTAWFPSTTAPEEL